MLEQLAKKISSYLYKNKEPENFTQKRYMNITETAKYMNVSYNTLKSKFIPLGLKSTLIDGIERFDKEDCDCFMDIHKY
jgi:hypothetical protein